MNGTCHNKGCENPATLTLTFGGRGYRICSTCEQELRPEIVATAEAARKAADQISGYLAGHFGTSIAQAAPLAQALVGQVISGQPLDDVVGNFRQAVIQETAANQEPAVQGNVIQAQQAATQAEAERQNLAAIRAAFTACPEEVLRRIAEGSPRFADWRAIDLRMGLDEHQADRRLADGTYRRMSAQVHGHAVACTLAPIQLLASEALDARKPAAIEVTPEHVSSPPGHGPGRHAGAPGSQHRQRVLAGLIAMALSIPVLIWGGITFWQGGTEEVANSGSATWSGVFLILLGLAMLILPPVIAIARSAHQAHERWISQYPAAQQAAIRRAEHAAAWGLTAAAAVALHEHNKRESARLAESVIHGSPAKQADRVATEAAQQHQVLLDAIRESGEAPPDPSATALGRSQLSEASQRRRRELGW